MRNKIRILSFTHYTGLYGANKSLLNLCEGLDKFNIEIQVVCPKQGPITERLKQSKKKYHVIPFRPNTYKANNNFSKLKAAGKWIINRFSLSKLQKIIFRENIDIIHSNSSVLEIGAVLSKMTNKPHVWHIREFGLEDYNLYFFPNPAYFKKLLHQSQIIIAISQAIFEARIPKSIPDYKKFLLYNGVIHKADIPSSSSQKPESSNFVFSIVGRLLESKGQLEAIKAFELLCAKYQDVQLLIVGEGSKSYTNLLKQAINENNLSDRIVLTGYIEDIQSIYDQTDVLLMCSKSEGMGRVTVEAMAQGIPVIGYNGGATPELIQHGENGFLYEGRREELACFMEKLYLNHIVHKNMGNKGIEKVMENFTIESYTEKFKEIIVKHL